MIEAYTWPIAVTLISTIVTIAVAAFKAFTHNKSAGVTKELTDKVNENERSISELRHQITTLVEAHREMKQTVQAQATISKEAFQTTDKKLEKISDLIIELIRN